MDTAQLRVTTELIAHDFAIENAEGEITEAQLLEILAGQIEVLIERKMEFLLSLLYRLDIDERKVDFALSPFSPKPPHVAIAELVLERQKQRAFTKMSYKPPVLGSEWEAF
jgi:hypothetical protein